MCWNDGYERKRFEKKLKKQREEYKKQGMTDAQIEKIEKKDWEIYRSDRCYYSHTQPLEFEDDNFDKEDCTPLCKFFSEELCDYIHPDYSNPHWWIDEIEDEHILRQIKKLNLEEIEVLTLVVFEGLQRKEAALVLGISVDSVDRKFRKYRDIFSMQSKDGDCHA